MVRPDPRVIEGSQGPQDSRATQEHQELMERWAHRVQLAPQDYQGPLGQRVSGDTKDPEVSPVLLETMEKGVKTDLLDRPVSLDPPDREV